jgi:hypothetical protein
MRKLIRAKVRFKGLSVGLDIHKKFIQFSVMDRKGNEIEHGQVRSTAEELKKLVERLTAKDAVQFSLEACGCFIWIFDHLAEQIGKQFVHVAHPAKLAAVKSREKNDSNDAWWLAYQLYEGTLPEAMVAEGPLRELRIATRELRWYTDTRSDAMRRIRSHLALMGKLIPGDFLSSQCKRQTTRKIIKEVQGNRGLALKRLWKTVRQASRVIVEWKAQVAELVKNLAEVKLMKNELPGFGTTVSSTVFAELGLPQRFRSAKAYAKSTGLTSGYRNTGGKTTKIEMTREGSPHARWALTRAIIGCMRCKKGIGAQVRAWVEERSQHRVKKKVIVAAARKLAEGVWRLFAMGEAFDLARAFPVKAPISAQR